MEKENKISFNNLIYALLFLVLGLVFITSTDDIVGIISKIIGVVLTLIGIIKCIIYIYMKGKLGDYEFKELTIGLLLVFVGVSFIIFASAFSFAIRTLIGLWAVFIGVNRMIYSFSTKKVDPTGFKVYFLTSIFMIILGIILISGIFDRIVGLLIILYSVAEIVDYVYFKSKSKNYKPASSNKKKKNIKSIKNGKVVDADIEEN